MIRHNLLYILLLPLLQPQFIAAEPQSAIADVAQPAVPSVDKNNVNHKSLKKIIDEVAQKHPEIKEEVQTLIKRVLFFGSDIKRLPLPVKIVNLIGQSAQQFCRKFLDYKGYLWDRTTDKSVTPKLEIQEEQSFNYAQTLSSLIAITSKSYLTIDDLSKILNCIKGLINKEETFEFIDECIQKIESQANSGNLAGLYQQIIIVKMVILPMLKNNTFEVSEYIRHNKISMLSLLSSLRLLEWIIMEAGSSYLPEDKNLQILLEARFKSFITDNNLSDQLEQSLNPEEGEYYQFWKRHNYLFNGVVGEAAEAIAFQEIFPALMLIKLSDGKIAFEQLQDNIVWQDSYLKGLSKLRHIFSYAFYYKVLIAHLTKKNSSTNSEEIVKLRNLTCDLINPHTFSKMLEIGQMNYDYENYKVGAKSKFILGPNLEAHNQYLNNCMLKNVLSEDSINSFNETTSKSNFLTHAVANYTLNNAGSFALEKAINKKQKSLANLMGFVCQKTIGSLNKLKLLSTQKLTHIENLLPALCKKMALIIKETQQFSNAASMIGFILNDSYALCDGMQESIANRLLAKSLMKKVTPLILAKFGKEAFVKLEFSLTPKKCAKWLVGLVGWWVFNTATNCIKSESFELSQEEKESLSTFAPFLLD